MTRNQRRRAAQKANTARSERIVQAARAANIALIVKRNLNSPIERSFYPTISSGYANNMLANSHGALKICRASGSMSKQSARALKAAGKY